MAKDISAVSLTGGHLDLSTSSLDLSDLYLENLKFIAGLKELRSLCLFLKSPSNITDTVLEPIAGLKELRSLHLSFRMCDRVTDAVLAPIAGLKELRSLYLSFSLCDRVTDAVLAPIAGLKELRSLYLSFSLCGRVTDAVLAPIAGLTLESLTSPYKNITNTNIHSNEDLDRMSKLTSLNLNGTSVPVERKQEINIATIETKESRPRHQKSVTFATSVAPASGNRSPNAAPSSYCQNIVKTREKNQQNPNQPGN